MVRSAGGNATILAAALHDLTNDVSANGEIETIRVLRREKLDSDVCIVLFHRGKKTQTGGSPIGLHLVAALKDVALVHHSIWTEFGGQGAGQGDA